MEIVKRSLREKGLKATKSRMEVLAFLIESHAPVSVEHIQQKLGRKSPDRVTLYRMMQRFYNAHLIRRIDFREGFERFEFQDHHHHHIVCTDCGAVEEFTLCEADQIARRMLKLSKKFSSVSDHSLELFGLCNVCVKA